PDLFPTIVDAAAHHDDLRLVKPALEGLKNVSKPVIRLQILNGVGRVLGEKNHFYRIANATKLQRAAIRKTMMTRIMRLLRESKLDEWQQYSQLMDDLQRASAALADDEREVFAEHARNIADFMLLRDDLPARSRSAAYAIHTYLEDDHSDHPEDEMVVFITVALTSLARHYHEAVQQAEGENRNGK
ncbi:MAG: hypothetical protein R6V19_07595, partial [Armatimonadota bacterium]